MSKTEAFCRQMTVVWNFAVKSSAYFWAVIAVRGAVSPPAVIEGAAGD
jgi:hypothetical protein